VFPFSLSRVFAFFSRPANVVAIAPPELRLRLIEGPETVVEGSTIVVQSRRWGLSRRITTQVVALEEGRLIVEEQRQGPFRSWRHARRFRATETGTEVTETIDYEPPGGLLGLAMTPAVIEAELSKAFEQRLERANELLLRQITDLAPEGES
jgi:ligand-binding SRPBCC domain-containing protein